MPLRARLGVSAIPGCAEVPVCYSFVLATWFTPFWVFDYRSPCQHTALGTLMRGRAMAMKDSAGLALIAVP